MAKKYESESVAISDVQGYNGQHFKKVEMIITKGKLLTIERSLATYINETNIGVASDLLAMISRVQVK
jgi:hypothetical protein